MKYAILVYHEEAKMMALSDEEMASIMQECGGWVEELERGGHHVFSTGLQAPATASTLRKRQGAMSITDGPFAETREFFGGLTVVEARDLNEAIQLAAKMPAMGLASIEVRPAIDFSLEMDTPLDQKIVRAGRMAYQEKLHA